MNFDNLFVVFVDGAQDLHQSLQTALSSIFKPNVQAQYYQIEAEGLQLSPSFGQVSALPHSLTSAHRHLSFSTCTIFISQSRHEILQLILLVSAYYEYRMMITFF